MRSRALPVTLAALVALSACERSDRGDASASQVPTAVTCTDARQMRQQAIDDRHQIERLQSDQAKTIAANRASFFASLASIADLKCRVTLAEADRALIPALEAARRAEDAGSFYETAQKWAEAAFISIQVGALLIQQLPSPPRQ